MIEATEVGVTVGKATLLAPVTVRVDRRSVLTVRGRNGTGKSTLLRVLAGARQPTSGTVRIGDEAVDDRDRRFRRRVAAMIGLPPMAPDLTVRDHVLLVASTWMGDPSRALRLADDVLDELGLLGLAHRFPHELSSGQTQLFGMALILARPFDVLILDEPEQRLDPEHLDTAIRALRMRRDAGAALVIATHDVRLADALADSELWLGMAA